MLAGLRLPPDRTTRRITQLTAGLVLFGVSIALMLTAGLGVPSWDVFHQGLALHVPLSFGWVVNIVSLVVLVGWIPLRQSPEVGTIANALTVGIIADLALGLLSIPASLGGRAVMLGAGVVLNGAATGLYIGAGLGPGPRDGLMTGLASITGRSIRSVRTVIEVIVLSAGWLLGGPVGPGTVIYAFLIGPLTQLSLDWFTIPAASSPPADLKPVP
ncbi:MAG: hypothetical protein LC739_03255 [Actinobacteria bacterium]|nr:hypothetical protein [Actinomycetota bacterium]